MRDDAFPRFLDLFNHRFLQLFFRAWADSRPIAQHDRPRDDRFIAYIGSMIGVGSAAAARSRYRPRSGQALLRRPDRPAGQVGLAAEKLHRRPVRREGRGRRVRGLVACFDAAECSRLGQANSALGVTMAARLEHLQRAGQDPRSASTPATWRSTCASCRAAICASRCVMRCFSISATSSIGRSSWRFRPARSSRCGSGKSGQTRLDELDGTELERRATHIAAMRAFIRRSDRYGDCRACAASAEEETPWPISVSKPSPASSTGSVTTPSSRHCATPRAPATAMSNWRIWLLHILQRDGPTPASTVDYFKVDRAKLLTDIGRVVDGFRKNETEMPNVSRTVMDAARPRLASTRRCSSARRRSAPAICSSAAMQDPRTAPCLHEHLARVRQDQCRCADQRAPQDLGELGRGDPAPDGRLGPARRRNGRALKRPQGRRARRRSTGSRRISPRRRRPARWIRSSVATTKSAR